MTYTVHVFEPYAVMCERAPSGEPKRSLWVARDYTARVSAGFYPYIPSRATCSEVTEAFFEEWWALAKGEAPAEVQSPTWNWDDHAPPVMRGSAA